MTALVADAKYHREELQGCQVLYRNKDEFNAKHAAMVAAGKNKLQVISDFDFTLTRYYQADGVSRSASCHMVLEHSTGLLPDTYCTAAKELQMFYYPIEQDPVMDADVKFAHMEDWVGKHNKLFMEVGLTEDIVQTSVLRALDNGKFRLRGGVEELLSTLEEHAVPLLIFSAGIENVLEFALQSALSPATSDGVICMKPLPENLNIISNRVLFDNGLITGFTEPVLHVYNKSCHAWLKRNAHFTVADGRRNVLLFGDSLGDIKMSQGYEDQIDNIIRVGFLNDRTKADSQLDTYLLESNYDMVIVGDPGVEVHQHLLEKILLTIS
jgi:cytosolic 5'-nucleotidase 3